MIRWNIFFLCNPLMSVRVAGDNSFKLSFCNHGMPSFHLGETPSDSIQDLQSNPASMLAVISQTLSLLLQLKLVKKAFSEAFY